MIQAIIALAFRQRLLVVILGAGIIGFGTWSLTKLRIDAVPDVTPTLVQIFTEAPGLAPEEVEQLITYPIEVSMNGLPSIRMVRSLTTLGLSVVLVYFNDGVDTYFARQLVSERLRKAAEEIPAGIGTPELGPITTGLGNIYQYKVVRGGYDLMELRSIQDWVIKYHLRTVPGVTEVLSLGGHVKQYQVLVDPEKLLSYGLTLQQLFHAIEANNKNVGASFIEKGSEEFVVRGIGRAQSIRDIENIVVASRDGTPVHVSNVARVVLGADVRRGAISENGQGEIVSGIVMKRIYEDTARVIGAVKEKVKAINVLLPEGVKVVPFYDQADLIERAIRTVRDALLQGTILIFVVLVLFLGNLRSALIVGASLPLSALFAFILMKQLNIPANLMSLGGLAIAVGMLVDGSIVVVENIYRHLTSPANAGAAARTIMVTAAQEVGRPIVFAAGVIIITFLPLFLLQGIEGKMFSPMAFSISFAMAGSLICSLTISPVLCSLFLKRQARSTEILVLRMLKERYRRVVQWAVRRPRAVLAGAAVLVAAGLVLLPRLGTEFVPYLDEGSIVVRVTMAPSISLKEALNVTQNLERLLLRFPEVRKAISKVGRSEIGGEPEPVNLSEIYVDLKPAGEWTSTRTKPELIEKMRAILTTYPGILVNFSQPMAQYVDELLSGVKAQSAVNLFGDDLDLLALKGEEIAAVISAIPGATDIVVEQISGQPQIQIAIDRQQIARHGLNVADVQDVIEIAIGGKAAGQVFEGQQRYDILVRFDELHRQNVDRISNLLISTPSGGRVPLSQLATIREVIGPKLISRENNQRRIVIQMNVEGRDYGSFMAEAAAALDSQVKLPPGYFITWGGQFEYQQRAMRRLAVIITIAIALIFLILYGSFNSLRYALLLLLNVPFAVAGGIPALYFSGQHLSVPAGVGLIALFCTAVLNGVVMLSYFRQLSERGLSLNETVVEGSLLRLRPVLMTALTTALGLFPLLFATGTGSEVERPLATVVVGGLTSSTLLTLLVLPAAYMLFGRAGEERPRAS